jgi:acetyl esterase/lipase
MLKNPLIRFVLRPLWALSVLSRAAGEAPPPNASFIDDLGRTHVTRVVSVPVTVSPEARARLAKPPPSILSSGATIAEQRERIDARQALDAAACLEIYPATVGEAKIAGVPVRVVTPRVSDAGKSGRVLINLHGGGFRTDAGSLLESIPIASLTRTKVIAVLYRLAPEHAFPAAVDDAVAVYRELLSTHSPNNIGLYGTSAGAILTAETAVRIKQLGLPMPAVLGIFSGWGDFGKAGDSLALFGLQGLAGSLLPHGPGALLPEYVGSADSTNPVLSPAYADLHGMPPTLFLTSTRDMLLSGTVMLHQAFLRADVDARLAVFEALPHAFWLDASLPESRAANEMMARFLDEHLGKPRR